MRYDVKSLELLTYTTMSALTFTFLWPTLFMHTMLAELTFFHMCYRQKHISQCLKD